MADATTNGGGGSVKDSTLGTAPVAARAKHTQKSRMGCCLWSRTKDGDDELPAPHVVDSGLPPKPKVKKSRTRDLEHRELEPSGSENSKSGDDLDQGSIRIAQEHGSLKEKTAELTERNLPCNLEAKEQQALRKELTLLTSSQTTGSDRSAATNPSDPEHPTRTASDTAKSGKGSGRAEFRPKSDQRRSGSTARPQDTAAKAAARKSAVRRGSTTRSSSIPVDDSKAGTAVSTPRRSSRSASQRTPRTKRSATPSGKSSSDRNERVNSSHSSSKQRKSGTPLVPRNSLPSTGWQGVANPGHSPQSNIQMMMNKSGYTNGGSVPPNSNQMNHLRRVASLNQMASLNTPTTPQQLSQSFGVGMSPMSQSYGNGKQGPMSRSMGGGGGPPSSRGRNMGSGSSFSRGGHRSSSRGSRLERSMSRSRTTPTPSGHASIPGSGGMTPQMMMMMMMHMQNSMSQQQMVQSGVPVPLQSAMSGQHNSLMADPTTPSHARPHSFTNKAHSGPSPNKTSSGAPLPPATRSRSSKFPPPTAAMPNVATRAKSPAHHKTGHAKSSASPIAADTARRGKEVSGEMLNKANARTHATLDRIKERGKHTATTIV